MLDPMDSTRPTDAADEGEPDRAPGKPTRSRLPAWVDAIPADLNVDDQLEAVARFSFRSLVVALARVHADKFMKVPQRVQLLTQINSQMIGVMDKRRVWLAEQVIKGNDRAIAEVRRGSELEMRDHAAGTDVTQQASRPTTRRGRPRKR